MSITELSVRRPAAVMMAVVLIISLGVIGYMNLGADLFPSVDLPVITIFTNYPGAGVEEIEEDIVKPIENEVSAISGIDTVRSGSGVGFGYTLLMFSMETDINDAFLDVQQALSDISGKLPEDASKPILKKIDKNAQPVMMLSVSGKVPFEELYNQADKIKQAMERLEGVGSVTLEGASQKELEVGVDKTELENYGISINTIVSKLKAENISIPAGEIEQENRIQTLRVRGEYSDIVEIRNLRIPVAGGTIRLAEIAGVNLKYPEAEKMLRLNGDSSIGVFIQKQSDANIVETAKNVRNELEAVMSTIPEGVAITIADDASTFINLTLREVKNNLIEGIITTTLVMFLFLRKWRSSLIILVSIPTSLISTFFMMYVFDFTLNLMSLLGLSMCIGILVDDSIVVLENIQRHLKMGKNPVRAAIDGRKEIGMAAVAITLCDIVVFGPVAFMSDMIGQFFKEFGLTVVFATSISLLVSFTITPMLSSRLLKKEESTGNENKKISDRKPGLFIKLFEGGVLAYRKILIWSLNNRWKVVGVITAGIILSISFIPLGFISTEFIPNADQSKLTIDVKVTPGSRLTATDMKVKEIERHLKGIKEIKNYFATVGADRNPSAAQITVNLIEKNKRDKSQSELAGELREWGKALEGIDFSVTETSLAGRTSIDGTKPLAINVTGPNFEVVKKLSKDVEELIRIVDGVTDVDSTIRASQRELGITIDRLAALEYGVLVPEIANTLHTAIQGTQAGVYRKNGNEYDIVVKFAEGQVKTKYDLGNIKIISSSGQQVYLEQVARISETDTPQELLRQDRQSLVTVSANIEGRSLGEINKDIKAGLKDLEIPQNCRVYFGGDQENMNTTFSSLIKVLIASVILVYMILVVLYESYLTPFIRMLSLPCGVIGALVALVITGKSLNLVTMIGFIMLDGLASKNGTLLIDYTNTLMKKRGLPLREALIESGTTRLRPIIMTSVTMVVGMLPSALALSEGSEIKSGMAIVLIGGMLTSTLLTPVLLPVVYTMIDDLRKMFPKRKSRRLIADGGVEA
ncbi:MAG: efflux RND transporter permease subunit [Clostridia bacterium]|nr:efflux RND transporter permease subunit [Clostridia bacterium]